MAEPSAILRAFFAAGDAGDIDAFGLYLTHDVVVHAPAGLSTTGLEHEQESWRRVRAAIPDIRHDFLEMLSEGSLAAARCIASGTLQGSLGEFSANGRRFSVEQALFARIRDDKIYELWEIVDTASLSAQLGTQPASA